jgi:hypothetical protein
MSTITTIISKIYTPGVIENRSVATELLVLYRALCSRSSGHELHGRVMGRWAALSKAHSYCTFLIDYGCSEIKCVFVICKTKRHLSPNNTQPCVVFGTCEFKRQGPNLTIVVFYNISPGKY